VRDHRQVSTAFKFVLDKWIERDRRDQEAAPKPRHLHLVK
jgi:hypothetical protein